jgi:PAS domain S-box-containing protein
MKDKDKTKEQLINELVEMRQRTAELEASETGRKRAEEALQEREAHLQAVFEAAGNISFVTMDLTGTEPHILDFSPGAERIFGYSREEVIGKPVAMLHLPEDMARFPEVLEAMRQRKSGFTGESTLVRKSGEEFPTLFTTYPIFDAEGNMTAILSVSIEITERKRAEEALRRRNRELALLHRAGQTFSSTLDLDQVLVTILEEVRRLLDVTACSVWLIDSETEELVCRQATGPQNEIVRGWRLAPGEGLVGWVARSGENLIVPDARADERHFKDVDQQTGLGLRSILSVPLRVKENVIGVIQVVDTEVDHFSPTDLTLLEPLAASAAIAIENARLYEAEAQRWEEAETLRQAAAVLTSDLDFEQVLDHILEQVSCVVPNDTVNIMFIEGDQAHIVRWRGYERFGREEFASTAVFRIPETANLQQMVESGEPMAIPDTSTYPGWIYVPAQQRWPRSYAAAPIIVRGEVIGFLNVNSATPGFFTQAHVGPLRAFADHAAAAIENARLYEQARQDAETRTVLLREVNHRVKNNLTAIIGLLYAERRRAGMEDQSAYQSIMQDLINRVQGLATVHSLLSTSGWTPLLLSDLTTQVIRSSLQMLPRDKGVSVEVTPSPVRVTPDQAHDLALVINELATNTVKHALRERDIAHITVRIALEDDTVRFEFRDDGPGYPEEVLQLERQNVGLDLIQNMVRKGLRGELSLHNDHGAVAVIQFKAKT